MRADHARLRIDDDEFAVDAGAFAGQGALEVLLLEIQGNELVEPDGLWVLEIGVHEKTNLHTPGSGTAQGIEEFVDGIVGFAPVVTGRENDDINGLVCAVKVSGNDVEVVRIDKRGDACLREGVAEGFH